MRLRLILLAAGNSRRFGRNKLIEVVNGKTLFRTMLDKVVQLPVDEIVVVTQYDALMDEVNQYKKSVGVPLTVIKNTAPDLGISHSIQLGVGLETEEELQGYIFCVADQPYLHLETLRKFVAKANTLPTQMGCVVYDGVWGNPTYFPENYREELLALVGDVGGKKIMKQYSDCVWELPVAQAVELEDMDYASDVERQNKSNKT